ncbi:hypothetical protein SVIO_020490 [Streptomyces violaceusniger]|uniref:Aldolase n=1 Tax=Streptomyces violaceusniger TaxID=68280 RepID=A0A4D4KX34_STRVO|nr:hypothetical protein SVIO_020490 [Streptomyces violaceusniger]
MGPRKTVRTSLPDAVRASIADSLAAVDAELARRYPGDPGTRQPVHTVYVPADLYTADTVRDWGEQALAALDRHAPDAASFAAVLGLPDELAEPVHSRVRAKLEREPVEDLRIDFEDGYGPRPTPRRTPRPPAPPRSSRPPAPRAPRRPTRASV